MANYQALFQPLQIKGLTIRNRFMSTSHSPHYVEHGQINDRYVQYHAEKARGGLGLSQFGGATSVSVESLSAHGQIDGSVDSVIPGYRRMAAAIHAHGAACTVQLTHGGRRVRWDDASWLPAFSASCTRGVAHGSFPAVMESHDIARIRADYAAAARRARDGDVDGVEISCQADTLIEQFWSPAMNQRSDGYGGSLQNRMRLGLEVLESIRDAVGDEYIVGIRMPGDEMLEGGLTQDDCVSIAAAYAASGLIDFVSVVGGQSSTHRDVAKIWPTMWMPSAAYLRLAKAVKDEVSIPVFHATRITDAATATHAVESGALDMVGMTRSFIADPQMINKIREGREAEIRPCVGAGYCVDRVITGHDALCLHNVAIGRETWLSHEIAPSDGKRLKVVIAGAGPGGLEAARVSALRGHDVTVLEAAPAIGGQLALAARASWRRDLSAIVTWLGDELGRLNVRVQLNTLAGSDDILGLAPDVVVVATGGLPNAGNFTGVELTATSWDLLAGSVSCDGDILLYDESGGHAALSCAEHAARAGARVQIVTPHAVLGSELGDTNRGAHMSEIYKEGITVQPDMRLDSVTKEANRLRAVSVNVYSGARREVNVDAVITEHGTLPNDDLYTELKPLSRNLGELDVRKLANGQPPAPEHNPQAAFTLFRIGDA